MRFAQPEAFWLLLLLPCLFLVMRLGTHRKTSFVRQLGEPAVLRQTPSRMPALQQEWLRMLLVLLPFLSTMVALADPRVPHGAPRVQAGVLDTVMVVDVSRSMAAEDYGHRSRLEQAREMLRHFLPALRGNRVGLVTFAGNSFRQAELTEDFHALDFILQHWVEIDATGIGGSNLGQAVDTALMLFPEEAQRQKLLLLCSDGGDGADDLRAVLTKATQRGVRIIALGLGSLQPSRIPLYDASRKFSGFLQLDQQVVTTRLNEAPLQQMAAATHGRYVRVTHPEEWRHLLQQRAVVGSVLTQDERKVFQPFLLTGLLAFGMQVLIARL
jgi:Ca-activated chloride channel family protein